MEYTMGYIWQKLRGCLWRLYAVWVTIRCLKLDSIIRLPYGLPTPLSPEIQSTLHAYHSRSATIQLLFIITKSLSDGVCYNPREGERSLQAFICCSFHADLCCIYRNGFVKRYPGPVNLTNAWDIHILLILS